MKFLVVIMSLIASTSAFADQCEALSRKEADRAVMLLQVGATVISHCAPCRERPGKPEMVKSLAASPERLGSDVYTTIKVNGTLRDMAYTYVKITPRLYVNVAQAIGCSTLVPNTVPPYINN